MLIFSTLAYERFLIREPGLLAGVVVLVYIGGLATLRAIAGNWPLLAAAGLSLAAYALVLVLDRYVAASMVLLFVALFAGIRLPKDSRHESIARYVAAVVGALGGSDCRGACCRECVCNPDGGVRILRQKTR